MEKINVVLVRYSDPKIILGVHYRDCGHNLATLVAEERLEDYFELGNEIEYTFDQIQDLIPIEWKHPSVTREWIMARVAVYDQITPKRR